MGLLLVTIKPSPAATETTVPFVWPVTSIVDIPFEVVDIEIPGPWTKPTIPVLDIITLPVALLTLIPLLSTIDSTAFTAPAIVTWTLPLGSDDVDTPAPKKLKLLTSSVTVTFWDDTPIPADTVGITHWLSPRRKVVADGVPVAASPIV